VAPKQIAEWRKLRGLPYLKITTRLFASAARMSMLGGDVLRGEMS